MTVAELAEKVREIAASLPCNCYRDGEFGDTVCPRCQLEQALEGDTDDD